MALTCALLGHAFDDYEVVRDREERGSEVVTSVREVAVCDRCGAERVLSENTEVTSIVDADHVGVADADQFAPADESAATDEAADGETTLEETAVDEAAADASGDDRPVGGAEILDEGATDASTDEGPVVTDAPDDGATDRGSADDVETAAAGATGAGADVAPESEPGQGAADEPAFEDDDAVILTDAPEEREYGEWPTHDGQDYRPWDPDRLLDQPDERDEDDGPTVADLVGANGREDAADTADDGPEFEEAAAPGDGASVYRCPNCEFERPAGKVSLRPGDACPECRTGYLVTERNP